MKARKALVWFVILKNFHCNTVKESDLENKLREGFNPTFQKFLTNLPSEILLNTNTIGKKLLIFQILVLEFLLSLIFGHLE